MKSKQLILAFILVLLDLVFLLIGLRPIQAAPPIQPLLAPDLAAYFPFNGNANDESGNGYDDTVVGVTPLGTYVDLSVISDNGEIYPRTAPVIVDIPGNNAVGIRACRIYRRTGIDTAAVVQHHSHVITGTPVAGQYDIHIAVRVKICSMN